MKYITLIVLLIISFNCVGQKTDFNKMLDSMGECGLTTLSVGGILKVADTLPITLSYNTSTGIIIPSPSPSERDTIKCILLITDTSYKMIFNNVLWQFGYEVRKKTDYNKMYYNGIEYFNGTQYSEWQHIYFLDENKKRFSKNIIVWDSKNIK
jgi:hypothetical protein